MRAAATALQPPKPAATSASHRADHFAEAEVVRGLAPVQLGMIAGQGAPGTDVQQCVFELPEALDRAQLAHAWRKVQERHEILRSTFHIDGESGHLAVHRATEIPLELHDWRTAAPNAQEERYEIWLKQDRTRGCDITSVPSMRLNLFRLGDERYRLVWTYHHVLLDGRSELQVVAEVFELYDAAQQYEDSDALPAVVPFRSHLAALRHHDYAGAETFFSDLLSGFDAPTPMPLEAYGIPTGASGTGLVKWKAEPELLRALTQATQEAGATLNTALQAAWAIVLSRYANSDDVVFGATRACRHSTVENASEIVGCLINTLPVRADVSGTRTLRELVVDLRKQWVTAREFEQLPLLNIKARCEVPANLPLFDSFVVTETYEPTELLRDRYASFRHRSIEHHQQTGLPICLAAYVGGKLRFELEFDKTKFSHASMQQVSAHFTQVLREFTSKLDSPLSDLTMLTAEEQRHLVELGQGPRAKIPAERLHERVFHFARTTPDKTALRDERGSLTYAELAAMADQVAQQLTSAGISSNALVGVACTRSREFPVGALGVLRAGAAYVPMELSLPAERLQSMMDVAGVRHVVCPPSLQDALPKSAVPVTIGERIRTSGPPADTFPKVSEDSTACVFFTSGTTGTPKAVPLTHRAVVSTLSHCAGLYGWDEHDVVFQTASLSFDASVEELFCTWWAGAEVILRPDVLLGGVELTEWLEERFVTVVDMPTAYWHSWVRDLTESGAHVPKSLKCVVVGGERASARWLKKWQELSGPSVRWFNCYGPTETTISSTSFEATGPVPDPVPIGRPFANESVLLMDRLGHLTPLGAAGEIWIGGASLSEGYLRRPELNAEKFVLSSAAGKNQRYYRSGDIGVWDSDGNLRYVGRADKQVKISGYRVELGEIQQALERVHGVSEAFVHFHSAELHGYYVGQASVLEVRSALKSTIPSYMVPKSLVPLDAIPLTPRGKVDTAALRELSSPAAAPDEKRGVCKTLTELTLATALAEVTQLRNSPPDENLFDLGLTSLDSLHFLNRIQRSGLSVRPEDLFRNPSIQALADHIDRSQHRAGPNLLVDLQPRGSRPPLFLFHSIPGDLLGYGALVHRLGIEQPCIGVQAAGLDDPARAHKTVRAMARAYADAICERNSPSPVVLGGWCFGGLLALETARELQDRGWPRPSLLLMESAPHVSQQKALLSNATGLLKQGPRGWMRYLTARQRRDEGALQLDPNVQFALNADEGTFKHRRAVCDANEVAYRGYQQRGFKGATLLVRATEHPAPQPDYGWSKYIQAIHVQEVPGDHPRLLDPEFVVPVATVIEQWLNSLDGSHPMSAVFRTRSSTEAPKEPAQAQESSHTQTT